MMLLRRGPRLFSAGGTTLKHGLDGAAPLGSPRFEALERFLDLLGRHPA